MLCGSYQVAVEVYLSQGRIQFFYTCWHPTAGCLRKESLHREAFFLFFHAKRTDVRNSPGFLPVLAQSLKAITPPVRHYVITVVISVQVQQSLHPKEKIFYPRESSVSHMPLHLISVT